MGLIMYKKIVVFLRADRRVVKLEVKVSEGRWFESHMSNGKNIFFNKNIFTFIIIFTLEFLIYTQISTKND